MAKQSAALNLSHTNADEAATATLGQVWEQTDSLQENEQDADGRYVAHQYAPDFVGRTGSAQFLRRGIATHDPTGEYRDEQST